MVELLRQFVSWQKNLYQLPLFLNIFFIVERVTIFSLPCRRKQKIGYVLLPSWHLQLPDGQRRHCVSSFPPATLISELAIVRLFSSLKEIFGS
jgi:hypothetical protein